MDTRPSCTASCGCDRGRGPSERSPAVRGLIGVLRDTVPEIDEWWADSYAEGETPMTLCSAGIEASTLHLFDDDNHPLLVDTVWPRMLQVVELALLVFEILWSDEILEPDAVTVDCFAGAGIICDLTRTRESIRTLLPLMGPETVAFAQGEVANHSGSRGFGVADVDWAGAGSALAGLDVRPEDVLPIRRSDD